MTTRIYISFFLIEVFLVEINVQFNDNWVGSHKKCGIRGNLLKYYDTK